MRHARFRYSISNGARGPAWILFNRGKPRSDWNIQIRKKQLCGSKLLCETSATRGKTKIAFRVETSSLRASYILLWSICGLPAFPRCTNQRRRRNNTGNYDDANGCNRRRDFEKQERAEVSTKRDTSPANFHCLICSRNVDDIVFSPSLRASWPLIRFCRRTNKAVHRLFDTAVFYP